MEVFPKYVMDRLGYKITGSIIVLCGFDYGLLDWRYYEYDPIEME